MAADGESASLRQHSQFFDQMLGLIPPHLYFPTAADADEDYAKRKKGFLKVPVEKSSKLAKKEARNQALKAKFDPENTKTVPQIQREAVLTGIANPALLLKRPPPAEDGAAQELEPEEEAGEEESAPPPKPLSAPSMDALRARVQQRIEEMRRKRHAEEIDPVQKQKKRDERRKKKEEKRKARKLAAGTTPKKTEKPVGESEAANNDEAHPEEQEASEDSDDDLDENIKFGTFDFSGGKPVPTYLSKNKRKPTLQQQLKKVETQREELHAMAGTEEGRQMKEDLQWNKALKRAKGEKLKDDPKRLKAAIKRENKKKTKSAQEWKERHATVAKQQAERQEKRQRNIDDKIQRRKDKKGGKKKGSGGRAGFEGKKQSFLNK